LPAAEKFSIVTVCGAASASSGSRGKSEAVARNPRRVGDIEFMIGSPARMGRRLDQFPQTRTVDTTVHGLGLHPSRICDLTAQDCAVGGGPGDSVAQAERNGDWTDSVQGAAAVLV